MKFLLKIFYFKKIINETETDCVCTFNENNFQSNLVEMNKRVVDHDS